MRGRSYPGADQAPTRSPLPLVPRGSQGRFREHAARPAAPGRPTGLDGFGPRSSQVLCRELVFRDAEHLVLGHRQDHSGAPHWGGRRTRTAGRGMFLPYGTGALLLPDAEALRDAHFEGAAYPEDLPPRATCTITWSTRSAVARVPGGCARGSRCGCMGRRVPRGARREARPRGAPGRRLRGRPERRALPAAQLTVVPFRLASDGAPTTRCPRRPRDRPAEGVPRSDPRGQAGVPVEQDDPRAEGAARLLRVAPHARRPHRRCSEIVREAAAALREGCEVYVPEMPEVQAFAERARRAAVLVAEDVRTAYGV